MRPRPKVMGGMFHVQVGGTGAEHDDNFVDGEEQLNSCHGYHKARCMILRFLREESLLLSLVEH